MRMKSVGREEDAAATAAISMGGGGKSCGISPRPHQGHRTTENFIRKQLVARRAGTGAKANKGGEFYICVTSELSAQQGLVINYVCVGV